MKYSSRSSQAGFTLLEMMLVVAIIALILGGAIKFLGPQLQHAQVVRVESDARGLETALMMYRSLNGFYPTTQQGLKALVQRPDTEPKPTRWQPMLSELPKDPYAMEYIYECPGKHNASGYDITSAGPDRTPGTADDIPGNWNPQ